MGDRSVGIAILGHGVVGGGVVRILHEQRELLHQRTGLLFDIRHVVVRNPTKHAGANRSAAPDRLPFTSSAEQAIDDPDTQIVLELMGGTSTAATLIERALKLGKPVVTANKSLLAARGAELFALARKH